MKEMYIAVSGAISREKQLATITNNLANVSTTGFKRQEAVFEVRLPQVSIPAMMRSYDPALNLPTPQASVQGDRTYVRLAQTSTDFSTGVLRPSEPGTLDVALEVRHPENGTAFFQVETPQGPMLTQMGNFVLNGQGELILPTGERVLGDGGTITLSTGQIQSFSVSPNGELFSKSERLGKLDLQFVEKPQFLERVGNGFFRDSTGQATVRVLQDDDNVQVRGGFFELSNVNIVEELVKMIELQRSFTTAQKSIQTMDEATERMITGVLTG